MLNRQIEYFYYSVAMAAPEICLYTQRFLKNNLLAVHFRTMVLL